MKTKQKICNSDSNTVAINVLNYFLYMEGSVENDTQYEMIPLERSLSNRQEMGTDSPECTVPIGQNGCQLCQNKETVVSLGFVAPSVGGLLVTPYAGCQMFACICVLLFIQ